MGEDPKMWSYWWDKYGAVGALEQYYPETLAANPVLVAAVTQVKSGLILIDSIMREAEQQAHAED